MNPRQSHNKTVEIRRLGSTYLEIQVQAAPNQEDSLTWGGKKKNLCPSRVDAQGFKEGEGYVFCKMKQNEE